MTETRDNGDFLETCDQYDSDVGLFLVVDRVSSRDSGGVALRSNGDDGLHRGGFDLRLVCGGA